MEAHQVLLVPDLLKGGKESNILESLFSVIDNAKVQFQKHTHTVGPYAVQNSKETF